MKKIWAKVRGFRMTNLFLALLLLMAVLQPEAKVVNNRVAITFGPPEAYAAGIADYSLGTNGTANNATINTALAALPTQGGLLHFKVGSYNVSGIVTRTIGNVTIEGEGQGTYFFRDGGSVIFNAGGNSWVFRDLAVDSNTSISMGATTGWKWFNVYDQQTYWTLRDSANGQINGATLNTTQLTTTTGNITTLNAPTGRGAYLIASVNATALEKAQADAQCDGTADDVQVKAALLVSPSVQLSSGNFVFADNVTISNGESVYLTSNTTVFYPTGGNSTSIFVIGAGALVSEVGNKLIGGTINATGVGYGVYAQSGLHNQVDTTTVNATIDNFHIQGASSSIRPDYMNVVLRTHNAGRNGLVIGQWSNAGKYVVWAYDNGVDGANCSGIMITGGTTENTITPWVWQNKSWNIKIDSGFQTNIIGGEFNSSWLDSLYLRNGDAINVQGTTFVDASMKGSGNGSFVAMGDTGVAFTNANFNNLVLQETANNNANYYFSTNGSGGTGSLSNIRMEGLSGKGINLSGASFKIVSMVGTGWQSETTISIVIPAGSTSASGNHLMGHTPYSIYLTQASSVGNLTGGFWPSWGATTITANLAVASSANITITARAVSSQQ